MAGLLKTVGMGVVGGAGTAGKAVSDVYQEQQRQAAMLLREQNLARITNLYAKERQESGEKFTAGESEKQRKHDEELAQKRYDRELAMQSRSEGHAEALLVAKTELDKALLETGARLDNEKKSDLDRSWDFFVKKLKIPAVQVKEILLDSLSGNQKERTAALDIMGTWMRSAQAGAEAAGGELTKEKVIDIFDTVTRLTKVNWGKPRFEEKKKPTPGASLDAALKIVPATKAPATVAPRRESGVMKKGLLGTIKSAFETGSGK